jgi:hypothetical protein
MRRFWSKKTPALPRTVRRPRQPSVKAVTAVPWHVAGLVAQQPHQVADRLLAARHGLQTMPMSA